MEYLNKFQKKKFNVPFWPRQLGLGSLVSNRGSNSFDQKKEGPLLGRLVLNDDVEWRENLMQIRVRVFLTWMGLVCGVCVCAFMFLPRGVSWVHTPPFWHFFTGLRERRGRNVTGVNLPEKTNQMLLCSPLEVRRSVFAYFYHARENRTGQARFYSCGVT